MGIIAQTADVSGCSAPLRRLLPINALVSANIPQPVLGPAGLWPMSRRKQIVRPARYSAISPPNRGTTQPALISSASSLVSFPMMAP